MELAEVVRRRRMVRRYTTDPVDPAVVDRALQHAVRAPSAGFSQGWAFVVLDTPDDVARFWGATTGPGAPDRWLEGMSRAPVVVLPCSRKQVYLDRYAEADKHRPGRGWAYGDEASWPVPYWHCDAAMASLLILQTVVDEGLGACFFGVPPGRLASLRAELGIPDDVDPVGAITIGHPAPGGALGSPARRRRVPLEQVVHRGGWQGDRRGDRRGDRQD